VRTGVAGWLVLALVSLSGVACPDKTNGPSATTGPRRSPDDTQTNVVARLKTAYSNIIVWDDGDYRCLAFGKRTAIQSCVNRTAKLDFRFEYVRMMFSSVALRPRPARILVLGLGGAALPSLVASLYPDARIDVVEIDRGVFEMAKRYLYYKPTARTRVHIEDAFKFVTRAADAQAPPQYNVIWVDCFDAKHIPAHLMTDRFVTGLRRILAPKGVLAANFWSTHASYQASVKRYKRLFTEVWRIKGRRSTNHVLFALRRTLAAKRADLVARAVFLEKRLQPPFPLSAELKRLVKLP
jgi:spermidine synthase